LIDSQRNIEKKYLIFQSDKNQILYK